MKNKITHWFLQWIGILGWHERLVNLEQKAKDIETDISGLKMEADIMYAKTLEKE